LLLLFLLDGIFTLSALLLHLLELLLLLEEGLLGVSDVLLVEGDLGQVGVEVSLAGGEADEEGTVAVVDAVVGHVQEVFDLELELAGAGNDLADVGLAVTVGLELTLDKLRLLVLQVVAEDALALLATHTVEVNANVEQYWVWVADGYHLHVEGLLLLLEAHNSPGEVWKRRAALFLIGLDGPFKHANGSLASLGLGLKLLVLELVVL